jgi:hypothetical protein
MVKWEIVEHPGYLGARRDEKIKEWNEKYGKDNWKLFWKVGGIRYGFLGVCALYEDAYFEFFRNNPDILKTLVSEASEVYDDEISNISSGLNYTRQETKRTHIQDIAIRRCLVRNAIWFGGEKVIRIRQEKGDHPLSIILSPGRVPFHMPRIIEVPETKGWWLPSSVESFYQSNRFLFVKKA